MSKGKNLWKSGKSKEEFTEDNKDLGNTLDLSTEAPENVDEEIDLEKKEVPDAEEIDEVLLKSEDDEINIKVIAAVATAFILLSTGALFILLNEEKIEITVPFEKYEDHAKYDVYGQINFESSIDIPLPVAFINNDVVINELDITFEGELNAGIKSPSKQTIDGYGNKRNVFQKYLDQEIDVDGSITEDGENPAKLNNAKVSSSQYQYVDTTSLEVVRSEIESNASYSDTLTGKRWYLQNATDWIPRDSKAGLLPHGDSYIGMTLKEGDKGTVNEGGMSFNWKVENGVKINGEQTVLLRIYTAYISDNLFGYEYQYQYSFNFYMSEVSSLPLKFELNINSDAKSSVGKLYSVTIKYEGSASEFTEGYEEIPKTGYKSSSSNSKGEFGSWIEGAPEAGNGTVEYKCAIPSDFNLQTGIKKGREEIANFNSYLENQIAKDKQQKSTYDEKAFVVEANYTKKGEGKWNFTIGHRSEEDRTVNGWVMEYNKTGITGDSEKINNPIMSMEDIPSPLTLCSAEEVMTNFDEIAAWAVSGPEQLVNYSKVKLVLGQNLVSKQSLTSPTSVINFGGLNIISILSDLSQGNLNPDDYSDDIDVEAAGSYAYFIDRKGTDSLGNKHQELAGVDAKDGLVLFNLRSLSSD